MRPGFVLLVAVLRDGQVHQTARHRGDLAQEELRLSLSGSAGC
jgi:hypothetical protein